jgi:hypothetical protein
MNRALDAFLRRVERWFVGLAMAILALLIERFVAQAIRRGSKASGTRRARG